MSNYVCIVFPNRGAAAEGMEVLHALHATGLATVFGHAILHRGYDGPLVVEHATHEDPTATGTGALLGGLAGMVGGPAGIGVGLAAGALLGASRDLFNAGSAREFLAAAGETLTPGKAAIVAEIAEDDPQLLDARMAQVGGTVMREARSHRIAARLRERVAALHAELQRRRAEFEAGRAERKAQALLQQVADAERDLRTLSEDASYEIVRERQEVQARIAALEEQLRKVPPGARGDVERRIAAMRIQHGLQLAAIEETARMAREGLQD